MNEKVLVTGGAGFIGSHLVDFLAKDRSVTVLDDSSTGRAENLKGSKAKLLRGSITDSASLEEAAKGAETIFHLAAQVSVPQSFKEPQKTMEVNVQGTLNILEAARKNDARVVFSSSCAVYGNASPPISEEALPQPLSPYAESKLLAEKHLQSYAQKYGLEAVALRYFNVYGPRQRPDSSYAAAVPAIAHLLIRGKAPTIYGDGEQTRDFVFVEDVARANLLAARTKKAEGVTFNIGSGKPTSINQLVELLRKSTGGSAEPVHQPPRSEEIRHAYADISRAGSGLGWKPQVNLEKGLQITVDWLRSKTDYNRP